MGLSDFFLGWFNKDDSSLPLDVCVGRLAGEIYYKELAIQACAGLVGSALSSSEFLTYELGREVRKDNYYALNVEPNPNQSAAVFWMQVASKLLRKNDCLLIQVGSDFYVADSYALKEASSPFKDNIYKNIVVDGYNVLGEYSERQVWHFKLNDVNSKTMIDNLNESYSKLIEASRKGFIKSKGKRGVLGIGTDYPQTDEAQEILQDLMSNKFKRFFDSEGDAVIPLEQGLSYTEIASRDGASSTANSSRETRQFADDIFDFVAMSYNIPNQLLKGTVADTSEVINTFMALCVNPIANMISEEVNRKIYGKTSYLERTYSKMDTSRVKITDLKDVANSLEVLTRIGAHTIDDNLKKLGLEPINTEWSTTRFMTKNYMPVERMLKEGG